MLCSRRWLTARAHASGRPRQGLGDRIARGNVHPRTWINLVSFVLISLFSPEGFRSHRSIRIYSLRKASGHIVKWSVPSTPCLPGSSGREGQVPGEMFGADSPPLCATLGVLYLEAACRLSPFYGSSRGGDARRGWVTGRSTPWRSRSVTLPASPYGPSASH